MSVRSLKTPSAPPRLGLIFLTPPTHTHTRFDLEVDQFLKSGQVRVSKKYEKLNGGGVNGDEFERRDDSP